MREELKAKAAKGPETPSFLSSSTSGRTFCIILIILAVVRLAITGHMF